jgi:very-short-patch-repair endonuclease
VKLIYNSPNLIKRRKLLRLSQTDAEKILWSKLRNKQIFGLKFYRQYSVGPYILDFYCPKYKLAIEIDGGQHSIKENMEYDFERTNYLKHHNIEVIRFWNNDVLMNIDGVLEEISKVVTPPLSPS